MVRHKMNGSLSPEEHIRKIVSSLVEGVDYSGDISVAQLMGKVLSAVSGS